MGVTIDELIMQILMFYDDEPTEEQKDRIYQTVFRPEEEKENE